MWIINTNDATASLYAADLTDEEGEPLMDDVVEFNENGTAQVTEEVGEALIERFDTIEKRSARNDA